MGFRRLSPVADDFSRVYEYEIKIYIKFPNLHEFIQNVI